MTTTTITTDANYDAAYALATELLTARVSDQTFPEGEQEKALGDALNNTWAAGLTVEAWVNTAAQSLA